MKLKLLSISAALCLSMMITGARPGLAQALEAPEPEPEWLSQMYQEGWRKVQEGVLQRDGGGGQVETFTYGEEGLRWTVQRLEQRVSFLEHEYNTYPSEDLAEVIDWLRGEIVGANESMGSLQPEPFGGDEMENCNISYGAHAYADPLTGSTAPGVTATADAYFRSDCGYIGNTYAYAYARATTGTTITTRIQEDPKNSGTWLDSAASASVGGNLDCYSYAYGSSQSDQLGINYFIEDTNFTCPIPPVVASITGPSSVALTSSVPCQSVTWTAGATGGSPGYTFDWYIGSIYQGSGSQLTKAYCSTNQTVTVQVIAFDTAAQMDSELFTTNITYTTSPGDDCPYLLRECT